jgi:hypothetical protein
MLPCLQAVVGSDILYVFITGIFSVGYLNY